MIFDKTKFQCIVYIYLRSGHKISVYCKNYSYSVSNNEITRLQFTEATEGKGVYFKLEDVCAIEHEQNPAWVGE